jgi:hypothetical protein
MNGVGANPSFPDDRPKGAGLPGDQDPAATMNIERSGTYPILGLPTHEEP